jgi:hypothetical protein
VLGGNIGSQYHLLCFVDLVIKGRKMKYLVESIASHKFMKKKVVKEMGLRVSLCGAMVKEVNSKAMEITGFTSLVHILLDKW